MEYGPTYNTIIWLVLITASFTLKEYWILLLRQSTSPLSMTQHWLAWHNTERFHCCFDRTPAILFWQKMRLETWLFSNKHGQNLRITNLSLVTVNKIDLLDQKVHFYHIFHQPLKNNVNMALKSLLCICSYFNRWFFHGWNIWPF